MRAVCVIAIMLTIVFTSSAELEPVPLELVRNGDFSDGYPINPLARGSTGFAGWFVSASAKTASVANHDLYYLEQAIGIMTITRLVADVRLALFRPSIGLDTAETYKLKVKVRQTGGKGGRIEVEGIKIFSIPDGDQWQELTFDLVVPETDDQPNIRKSTSIKIFPPDNIGGKVAVEYVSLTAILPDKILPQNKNVFIETKDDKVFLDAIFVRRGATGGEILAAHNLRQGLYWYCGYSIPVFFMDNEKTAALHGIYIGQAAIEKGILKTDTIKALGFCGYAKQCADGQMGICGEYESGTVCAAAALLNDLGIHVLERNEHHFPYRDEVAVPNADYIICRSGFIRKIPAFEYSLWHGPKQIGQPWGFAWERSFMGDTSQMGPGAGGWVHNAGYMVPFEEYSVMHPEYFAMDQKGNRLQVVSSERFDVHLCMSNPDVQRIAAANLLKWMDKQNDRKYFVVSPGDGLGYCECANCRAWDAEQAAFSKTDRYMRFVNILASAVAEKHPAKRVCMIAYTDRTEDPPKREKPVANVDVFYCLWSTDWRCKQHPYCIQNKEGVDNLEGWLKIMPGRVHIFDYPNYTLADAQRLRYFHKKGVVGVAHCGFSGSFRALTIWMLGRMFWDINLNIDAEINRFMDLFYGSAAIFMRQYFDLVQNALELYAHEGEAMITGHSHGHGVIKRPKPAWSTGPFLLTSAEMDRAYALCVKAEKAAAGDKKLLHRIQEEKKTLLIVDLTQRNPVCGLDGLSETDFAVRLAEFLDIARKGSSDRVFYNSAIDKWLLDVARLDVQKENWRTDTNILAIIANPGKALQGNQIHQLAIEGGWSIPAKYALGGQSNKYQNREAVFIRRQSSGYGKARFLINLKTAINDMRLVVEGMDDEKKGKARWRVLINGQMLVEGENAFDEHNWSKISLPVPATLLRTGINEVVLNNTTSDDESGEMSRDVAIETAGWIKHDYNWGWIGVAGIELVAQ